MEPPDRTEKNIRFGCGFVFGLAFFGLGGTWLVGTERGSDIVWVLIPALLFGLVAVYYGNQFWRWFVRWFM